MMYRDISCHDSMAEVHTSLLSKVVYDRGSSCILRGSGFYAIVISSIPQVATNWMVPLGLAVNNKARHDEIDKGHWKWKLELR